jgi:multiple sugar transport system substrate-binding protein
MARKNVLLLLGLALLLVVAPVSAQDEVTVRFFNFTVGSDYVEEIETIVAAFEAENPGINIEVDGAPYGDYFTLLQTDVISGDAPDVFELNYENFVTYAANGVLLDLTDLTSGDAPYYPRALDAFNYEGQQLGLPETFSTVLLYYNKTLFDQAGLEYPTTEWTWDDAMAAATAIRALGDDTWGFYSPIQYHEFYKKAAQQGGCEFFNEDMTESTINSEGCVQALDSMVEFVRSGVMPTQAQLSGVSDTQMFLDGKIGMWVTGIWMLPALADMEDDWDVQIEPMINQHAHHFFSNAVVVSADTDVAEAAVKWAEFLTASETAATVRVNASWELPALDQPEYFEAYLAQPPENREAVFQALESAVPPPVIERQQEMQDTVDSLIARVVDGELTAQQALDEAKAALDLLVQS